MQQPGNPKSQKKPALFERLACGWLRQQMISGPINYHLRMPSPPPLIGPSRPEDGLVGVTGIAVHRAAGALGRGEGGRGRQGGTQSPFHPPPPTSSHLMRALTPQGTANECGPSWDRSDRGGGTLKSKKPAREAPSRRVFDLSGGRVETGGGRRHPSRG